MKEALKRLAAGLVVALAIVFPLQAQVPAKPDLIEVIEISGEINRHVASNVAEAVDKLNENPKVKAVLLIVDTPGGGASASAVLYQALGKIKVPVVAYCEYLCASGGVYAAMAPSVKYIGVRDDTIGGSVGVIMQMTRFNRLLNWAMIDNETFKSGALKDAGNPTRDASPADRAYLQGIVDTLAKKFYGVVLKARPKVDLAEIKTAKIFIGAEIVKVGLADAVMTRAEALAKTKELSGSKNAFTRQELEKVVKNASEAAAMNAPIKRGIEADGWVDRSMKHVDTLMEIVGEVREGESVKFEYRMPYRF
jgi:signal peptide peptidase SppA